MGADLNNHEAKNTRCRSCLLMNANFNVTSSVTGLAKRFTPGTRPIAANQISAGSRAIARDGLVASPSLFRPLFRQWYLNSHTRISWLVALIPEGGAKWMVANLLASRNCMANFGF